MRTRRRFLPAALFALVLGAAWVGVAAAQETPAPGDFEFLAFVPSVLKPAQPTPVPKAVIYGGEEAPTAGDPAAPVRVYEFSDYQCPACRSFALGTIPSVRDSYVARGQVALVFVDFPLPQHLELSMVSHEAAHCALEQGKFWEMHDKLFQSQDDLYYNVYPRYDKVKVRDAVVPLGEEIGLDGAALRACLDSERYRRRINTLMSAAIQLDDVGATPTIMVESAAGKTKLVGVYSFIELSRIIDRALELSGTPSAPGPDAPGPDRPSQR